MGGFFVPNEVQRSVQCTVISEVDACCVIPQEINELQNRISNTCVMVQMDNSRGLDMDRAIEEFRRRYEGIASRSRAEAEAWFHGQVSNRAELAPLIFIVPETQHPLSFSN